MLKLDGSSLSKEEIKKLAPSVFTKTSSPSVSDKYNHLSTELVIDDMGKLGWNVVDAKQVNARKKTTMSFQKHLLTFVNNDFSIDGKDGDVVIPTILLTNSHDGKSSFTFTAGLFRMICENGLVVSTTEYDSVKIRHMGYTFEELQIKIKDLVKKLPQTVESMNKMVDKILTEEQILDLAEKSVLVRLGEKKQDYKVDIEEILEPKRVLDRGDSLWKVFNVLQEKLIQGEFNYSKPYETKVRKARKIKNFSQDMQINEDLFNLALEYV